MGRAFERRKSSKMKRWDKMSKVFPKLAKNITIAAKEGEPDPELNHKLRAAIQNAKAENMPKENIEAAIKRAVSKDSDDIAEITYEGKGPHGVLLFIECASDNPTRTVANIKSYFNKIGGEVLKNGSLEFMFKRIASFELEHEEGMDLEELELALIDAGLEELELYEGTIYIEADFKEFGPLSKALGDMGLEPRKSELKRVPTSPVEFSEAQLVDVEKLIDRIEEDDDVQAVFANIA